MNDEEVDIIFPEDDLEVDTPATTNEPEEKAEESTEQVNQPKAEEPQKEETPEDEDKKVLEYLNSKGLIKFNGENVQIKDLNDLVTNYQKGLNYDKHEADQKDALDYIKDKASKLGISTKEYIGRVKAYEEEQKKKSQEADVERYVRSGVDEQTAREIVQTRLAREEFEKERAEYQKRLAEEEKKQKEDAEYLEFIKTHPEVKVDEIPQEVFDMSRNIGINAAYNQYENKLLKEKIKQLEQAQKNASSSPVSLTSDGSSVDQASKDAFLEGFDSE